MNLFNIWIHDDVETPGRCCQGKSKKNPQQRENGKTPNGNRCQLHYIFNPEKPKNAKAKSPAKIKAIGSPWKTEGTGAKSVRSLAQLIKNSARANPIPEPTAKASDSQNPFSFRAFRSGTAKMIQLVVIKTT